MQVLPDYQIMFFILLVLKLGEIQSHHSEEILLLEDNLLAIRAEAKFPCFPFVNNSELPIHSGSK